MYACLAVTCYLHFWQNDRDFLRATVVTRGWNGYRNKSQHRKSTLEKKILPPFQQGFEPATFQSWVRRSNHWAIPAPWRKWFFTKCFCLHDGWQMYWCWMWVTVVWLECKVEEDRYWGDVSEMELKQDNTRNSVLNIIHYLYQCRVWRIGWMWSDFLAFTIYMKPCCCILNFLKFV